MVGKQKSSTRALRFHNLTSLLSATLGHCFIGDITAESLNFGESSKYNFCAIVNSLRL